MQWENILCFCILGKCDDHKKYLLISEKLVAVLGMECSAIIINILWEANWEEQVSFKQFKGLIRSKFHKTISMHAYISIKKTCIIKWKINLPSFKDIASLVSHLYSDSFFSMVFTPEEYKHQILY